MQCSSTVWRRRRGDANSVLERAKISKTNEAYETVYRKCSGDVKDTYRQKQAFFQDMFREKLASIACDDFGKFENDNFLKNKVTGRAFEKILKQRGRRSPETI